MIYLHDVPIVLKRFRKTPPRGLVIHRDHTVRIRQRRSTTRSCGTSAR